MPVRSFGKLLVVLVVLAVCSAQGTAEQTSQNLDRLRSRIEAAMTLAQGAVGVSITHLESKTSIAVNGDEPFPMASTFKLRCWSSCTQR